MHCTVLGVREDRDGWFDHFCPESGLACHDGGLVYSVMVRRKQKEFDSAVVGGI